jgi:hypothetical protein
MTAVPNTPLQRVAAAELCVKRLNIAQRNLQHASRGYLYCPGLLLCVSV